ncbi:MAG: DNA helicase RecQ [Candidatus Peribacteraceae bacterium]|nr:DNA helicase RecQ [Candidatus Peribacteraceae bacterium]
MTPIALTDLAPLLQKHFGYRTFRPLQEQIIQTMLGGKDCLVVMPTGSGKSLCFQLPALCTDGVTLVISPLIALMKDQVDGLRENGIPAAFLNSSQTATEQAAVRKSVERGDVRLLYIAPERLATHGFEDFLESIRLRMIAIDEAHCISEWGHEFRPDYRNLRGLRCSFPRVPCIALTATATPRVREDIREQLSLKDAPLFLSSFNRANLTYHVYPKSRSFERLLLLLRKAGRLPAIVYCFSRKDTEALAADLAAEGFSCLPYHAGLDSGVRRSTQEKFMRDELQIVTATIAFGMGIDKPDVRTVVHMDLPKNIEGYYQETGRAGRDGLPSDCIFFYSYGDKFKQEFFIGQMQDPAQQRVAREKLEHMLQYGELAECRRGFLLRYFGEDYDIPDCKGCDRCLSERETFDATEIAQKILSGVLRTGERFGAAHVCDVLRGKNTERIRSNGQQGLPVFGSVTEFDDRQLRELISSLVSQTFLRKADGQYPTLSLTDRGRLFLAEKTPVQLPVPEVQVEVAERAASSDDLLFDPKLFEDLRRLRRSLANAQGVAAFVIFGDRSLREMAAYFPQRPESFRQITGVSDRKLEEYGSGFLDIIRSFSANHGMQERMPKSAPERRRRDRIRTVRRKDSTYEETRVLLARKLPLSEIVRIRGVQEGTIIQHIEALALAGTALEIDYLKPPAPMFLEISAAFDQHGMEALSPVFNHFEGKYPYDVLRLARIFLRQKPH